MDTANGANGCIFCKIIDGEIPSLRVFENDGFIVIRDIQPQAKVHLLVLPKKHCATLEDRSPGLMDGLFGTAIEVAHKEGLLPKGFRSVINTGPDGGQTVFHLHLHILGGEALRGRFA